MKKLTITFLLYFLTATFASLQAQSPDAHDKLKAEINKVVQEVEQAEAVVEKREILNRSFDKLITAFDRVKAMENVSDSDKEALTEFKNTLREKKNELNGDSGYEKVPDSELDDFANYVQQDIEQADRVITISLTTALLIVIILLLL